MCLLPGPLASADKELQKRHPHFLRVVESKHNQNGSTNFNTWLLTAEKKHHLKSLTINDTMESNWTERREHLQFGYFVSVWSVANNNCTLYNQRLFLERTSLYITFSRAYHVGCTPLLYIRISSESPRKSNTLCYSILKALINSSVIC